MAQLGSRTPEDAPRAPIRAAEYVRMSTEHQKYSTENQGEIRQQDPCTEADQSAYLKFFKCEQNLS